MPIKPIVHLICNAHIDPIWKWTWEEGAREAISTFRTACDILDDYPTFIFNHNESLLYEWVEEYDPPLFARIQAHVKAGRWNISGGWYIQPDVNLPSGETIVRCIIEGRRYFDEKFGVRPPVAYNFDSFGHPNSLPQLLVQSGSELYIHGRPYERQLELPAPLYKWRGADGKEILSLRPAGVWYCTPNRDFSGDLMWAIDQAHIGIENARATGQDAVVLWGLGDHGGGPTRDDLDQLNALIAEMQVSDIEIRHSTPEAYLERVKQYFSQDIPVYEGELQRVLSGTYTSVAPIKREMRRIEAMMASAERWSAMAWWRYGIRYPADELRKAWKRIMLNAFHDVLTGALVEHALPGVHEMFGYAGDVTRRVTVSRQHYAIPNVEPTLDTIPFFVLNPHGHTIQSHVGEHFLRAYAGSVSKGDFALYDDRGQQIVHQEKGGSAVLEGTQMQPFLGFVADIPAMTARRYEIRFEDNPLTTNNAPKITQSDTAIAIRNRWWKATFKHDEGALSQLEVLSSDKLLLNARMGLQAMDDSGHAWGGMDRAIYNEAVGQFEPLSVEDVGAFVGEEDNRNGQAVRVIHAGEVSVTIECLTKWQHTRASIQYTFYADLPHIDINVRLYMQARQKMIKFVMPFDLSNVQAICEVPYGVTSRTTDATEHPYHRWLRLETDDLTIGLTNNGQAGFDISQVGLLGLSLTRGAVHAKHDEDPLDPNISYTFLDQEQIDTRFRLIASDDSAEIARQLIPLALELNHPLESFFVYHPPSALDAMPAKPTPFVEVKPASVAISSLKKSERGDDLILRLYETIGQATSAEIRLDAGEKQRVDFGAHEIKTWRISKTNNGIQWQTCNLIEEVE